MTDLVIDLAWLEGVSGRLAEAASVSKTETLPDRIPIDLREVIHPPKQPADP
ncbi:hypothetical protein [Embleya sp. NPDC005575]|uniref:hypothetical protein n=1 Tax=Embleya sp. NPDC005575 TaxID=3156892 RepID=UPI0033BEC0EB